MPARTSRTGRSGGTWSTDDSGRSSSARSIPRANRLSDFTEGSSLQVTIAGVPFAHLLYHFWLAFSAWQYVKAIQDVDQLGPRRPGGDLGGALDHQGEDTQLDVGHDPARGPVEHRADAEPGGLQLAEAGLDDPHALRSGSKVKPRQVSGATSSSSHSNQAVVAS